MIDFTIFDRLPIFSQLLRPNVNSRLAKEPKAAENPGSSMPEHPHHQSGCASAASWRTEVPPNQIAVRSVVIVPARKDRVRARAEQICNLHGFDVSIAKNNVEPPVMSPLINPIAPANLSGRRTTA